MKPAVEVFGIPVASSVALWLSLIGVALVVLGMVGITPFKRFLDEEKLRADPDIKGIVATNDVPSRVFTPLGKRVRTISAIALGAGLTMILAAYLYENS